MMRLMTTFLTAGLLTTAAIAADDPIAEREKLMKAIGDDMKTAAGMVQGKVAYDAGAAAAAMTSISEKAGRIAGLFPEGSGTGKTDALPVIWEQKADFDAKADKLKTEAAAAAEAAAGGLDAFKASFVVAAQNCKGCHETYRKKDS
jgi:Cytochrome c556